MRIEHIALWARDVEGTRAFYERYFGATAGARYENQSKQFRSYFLSFADGARVELMHSPRVGGADAGEERLGYAHLAISLGSEAAVDALTGRLRADGYAVIDGPRRTGDGYYESVVLDPDGNRIELTV
jgi:lactoylglutathione lyase